MKRDLSNFYDCEKNCRRSVLSVYSWSKPCISLGYSQKIEEEVDLIKAKELGWDVVARPTGGGIVFHNTHEVTYSLAARIDCPAFPSGLIPSYMKISEAIVAALRTVGITAQISKKKAVSRKRTANLCFSYPAEYEIVVEGKKIVGSAQKRGRIAMLQQGSVFMSPIERAVFTVLKKPFQAHNAVSVEEVLGKKIAFDEMADALIEGFNNVLGISFNDKKIKALTPS